ncbi:MAG TPA: hypothetical protein VGC36_16765 [Rhizomicrobium sp.]
MSNKKDKDKGLNRRAVLTTAAAAAGAALPLVSVTAKAQGRGTRVTVDLGGVELPRQIADNLESDIRRTVLMAVARAAPRTKFKDVPLGPGIRGIIIRPVDLPFDGGMMGPRRQH